MRISQNLRKRLNQSKLLSQESGFTLIELMIVIAILALLAGFVGTNLIKRFDEAKVSSTKIQMKQVGVVLDDFRRVCGFYPSTEQGLDALVHAPAGRTCKNYDPDGFMKKIPQDAWGNEFLYIGLKDGQDYELKSMGPTGKEGGEGANAAISSKDLD